MSETCTVRRSRAARAEMLWRPGAIGLRSTKSLSSGDTLHEAIDTQEFTVKPEKERPLGIA